MSLNHSYVVRPPLLSLANIGIVLKLASYPSYNTTMISQDGVIPYLLLHMVSH